MDWREIAARRWQIGGVVAAVLVVGWYVSAYSPRRQESQALEAQTKALAAEKLELEQAIAAAKAKQQTPETVVARLAPPEAGQLAAVDRLKYFLESITEPANDLDLAYFTVTPLAPNSTPAYEEVPFSIAVSGSYASLADFLYQLEYERDFVVRDVNLTRGEPNGVRANFQLAALLPRDPSTKAAPEAEDPGRPTSLELARDPFTRAPAVLVKGVDGRPTFLNVPPGLALSGILTSGPRLAAIINHEPYAVGDVIDNKRITRITRAGVEMTDDARTYFLEMPQPAVTRKDQGNAQTKEASRR